MKPIKNMLNDIRKRFASNASDSAAGGVECDASRCNYQDNYYGDKVCTFKVSS